MGTGSGEGISTFFLSPVFDAAGGNGKRLGSDLKFSEMRNQEMARPKREAIAASTTG